MSKDLDYMQIALKLAAQAKGQTLPNPMVGAVVVRDGRIVGRGFHEKTGGPHAEVQALKQAGARARGGTLYVSLEPCAHVGRTPPCTQSIAKAGIRRVVAAMNDPNPLNRGRGVRWLNRHQIRTRVGLSQKEAVELNRIFLTRMRLKRPFVTVKVAQSLDGKIATASRQSQWISSPAARRWVQKIRAESDAILVGAGTLLEDDPRLTVRSKKPRHQPLKVILDSHLKTQPTARLFASKSPVLVATTKGVSKRREAQLRRVGAQVIHLPALGGRVSVKALLRELHRREISRLLVEGGGEVISSFFQAKAVDQIAWVVAAKILGGREAPTSVGGSGIGSLRRPIRLKNLRIERLASDLLFSGEVVYPRG